jgi:hypothetical protein
VDDGPEAGRPAREKDPFTRVFYTSFFTGQGVPAGCVPSFVSLGLALLMAFAHGPLAGIGFLVFTALGRAFTFFLIIRYFLEGRHVNPRLFLIANWVFCWLLTVWLAGG